MTGNSFIAKWKRAKSSAVFYGVFSTLVRVGSNVLLLPLVLSRLSTTEIALWWVFLAIGNLTALADFGFGQTISRAYNFLWAGASNIDITAAALPRSFGEPNVEGVRQLTAAARLVYGRLGLLTAPVLAAAGYFFVDTTAAESPRAMEVWVCWGAYLLVVGFAFATSHWTLACQGLNRVREVQAGYLWSGLAYFAVASLLLLLGLGLFAMVVAVATRAVVMMWRMHSTYLAAVGRFEKSKIQPDLTLLARLWPNTWKYGVLTLCSFVIANSGVLISCRILGPKSTASFGLTAQVGLFLVNLSSLWLSVKWPELTMLRTQARLREMALLFARRLSCVVGTFVVTATGAAVAGNSLLAWKGTETRLLDLPLLAVYFAYLSQQIIYTQFGLLAFSQNVAPFYRVALITTSGLVILSLALTPRFGLWGIILGPLIAEGASSAWYSVWQGFSSQPLGMREFVRVFFGRKP